MLPAQQLEKIENFFKSCTFLDLEGIELRDYQLIAAWKSREASTLIVLPTGLGKTLVALLHVAISINSMKHDTKSNNSIIILLAPTRALLVQHQKLFIRRFKLPKENFTIIDGSIIPTKRADFYLENKNETPCVLFMTPQTLQNDLSSHVFPVERLSTLIFDEAHHATSQHPYTQIFNDVISRGFHPLILAMTASPGDNKETINGLLETLHITPDQVFCRTRDDHDVRKYIHPIKIERIGVELPEEWRDAWIKFMDALAIRCNWLLAAGVKKADIFDADRNYKKAISKKLFIELLSEFGVDSNENPARYKILSKVASCIKIHHALEQLEMYGLQAVLDYYDNLVKDKSKKSSKATNDVLTDVSFNQGIEIVQDLNENDHSSIRLHPKLLALEDLLGQYLVENTDSRVLIFANYRTSVRMIINHLKKDPRIRIHKFVGQSTKSKKDKGMNRKKQEEILEKFKSGKFNSLVATSVAEEGLDVAECDLVVFYESVSSTIKFIQRKGRTGRKRTGSVAILYTLGTMDEYRLRGLDNKLAKLRNVYISFKKYTSGYDKSPIRHESTNQDRKRDTLDNFINSNSNNDKFHLSISDLKGMQHAHPIKIKRDVPGAEKLISWLHDQNIPTLIVENSPFPDIIIDRHVAIDVYSYKDAENAFLQNKIFMKINILKNGFEKSIVLLWENEKRSMTSDFVVKYWLKTLCKANGLIFLEFSKLFVLGIILKDARKLILNSA